VRVEAAAVERALETLRAGLEADGFDLRLGSLNPQGGVEIILEAKPEACLDCLVPEAMMIQILERAIRDQDATLEHVVLSRIGFA
jgi:hypothetical protein